MTYTGLNVAYPTWKRQSVNGESYRLNQSKSRLAKN